MVWYIQLSQCENLDKWFSSPLFLGKTTWFGIPDLCNGEEGLMRHGADVHRVRDGNDV